MRVYKYTSERFCRPWSFRLGTLYDYRDEGLHGDKIGDGWEGSFRIDADRDFHSSELKFSAQTFPCVYAKGDRDGVPFCALTIQDLLVFSAVAERDDRLYGEFLGSDCCYAIDDFHEFSERIVAGLGGMGYLVDKWKVSKCSYVERVDGLRSAIPDLAFAKGKRYAVQHEVRLCVSLYSGVVEPVVIKKPGLSKLCRIISRK